MKELTGKTVKIEHSTDMTFRSWYGAELHGPRIPHFKCVKMKGNLHRLTWSINIYDPRYEILNAVLALTPCVTTRIRKVPIKGRWIIPLSEYRDICGREGPLM